jgi:hypothetical protein
LVERRAVLEMCRDKYGVEIWQWSNSKRSGEDESLQRECVRD